MKVDLSKPIVMLNGKPFTKKNEIGHEEDFTIKEAIKLAIQRIEKKDWKPEDSYDSFKILMKIEKDEELAVDEWTKIKKWSGEFWKNDIEFIGQIWDAIK